MNIFLNASYFYLFTYYTHLQLFSQSLSDSLIGVHCTHGLNRTGYMICRYLIQKLKWEPKKAIDGKLIQLWNYLKNYHYNIMQNKLNF